MSIYMKYDGIHGNVTADGYAGHIALSMAGFEIKRNVSMEAGNLANREATRPTITAVKVTKRTDISTTSLFKESVSGAAGKTVVIKFVRTGAGKVQEYMSYTLENCLVSGFILSAGAEGEPVENIALSFSKVMISYSDFDAKNKASNPQRVGYDLAVAKPL